MELSKAETAQVEVTATEAECDAITVLSALQLALVGGGIGETVL